MARIIEDLHGGIYKTGKFNIYPEAPCPIIFSEKESKVCHRDLISNEYFLLVKYEDKVAGLFLSNQVWVAFQLEPIGYNKKNDIRYEKGKNPANSRLNHEGGTIKKSRPRECRSTV